MLRHCVVIITRYCAMIALALVVGFATGVFIEVVKLKATGADVSFIWRPVTPRYQVADRAEMTGQAVAQITQPPTPDPAFKERRDARPDPASIEERRAALRAYVGCLRRSAKELDDGKSDAETIADAMISSCAFEFWAYVEAQSRPDVRTEYPSPEILAGRQRVAKALREKYYGMATDAIVSGATVSGATVSGRSNRKGRPLAADSWS